MSKLAPFEAKNIRPGGTALADGTVTGLRLITGKTKGQGKWELRFVSPVTEKRCNMGFGTYPSVSIAEARELAA